MKVSAKLDDVSEIDHEDLMYFAAILIALQLRPEIEDQEKANSIAEGSAFDVAMVFDQSVVEINGKTYRPKISWVDENENILPDTDDLRNLHEYVMTCLDDIDDLTIDWEFFPE